MRAIVAVTDIHGCDLDRGLLIIPITLYIKPQVVELEIWPLVHLL